MKMDVEGERITPQGWRVADGLFVKHSEPFLPETLIVIGKNYAVSTDATQPNANEFSFGYEEVARISTPLLRFVPINSGTQTRSFNKYIVVPASAATEDVKAKTPSKIKGGEWKIDGTQPRAMHLTARAAIRYLTQARAKASDPAIQSNAREAISRLAAYQ